MGILKDMMTGKDNQTHDVVRVAMTAVVAAQIAVLVLGVVTYIYGYYFTLIHPEAKLFDIQTFFTSTSTYSVAIAAFLMGGAASLFMKRTTEPDGSTTETESITSGKQPDTKNTTIINVP